MIETIGRLSEEDWPTLRAIRLAALAADGHAFWATLGDELRYTREEWADFARKVTWFIARIDGQPVAIGGTLRRPETPDEAELIGVWVAPRQRRLGTASRLVRVMCDSAWAHGASAVVLWVAEGNQPARELYESLGFQATGEHAPMPHGRGVEHRMRADMHGRQPRRPRAAQSRA